MDGKLIAYLLAQGAPPNVIDRLVAQIEQRNGVAPANQFASPRVNMAQQNPLSTGSALQSNPVGRGRAGI